PTVYYSLEEKAKGIVSKPRAIPARDLTDEETKNLPARLAWFKAQLPAVVASSAHRYGGDGAVGVVLNYTCTNPVTMRKYLQRIMNDAFDRNPTLDEMQDLSKGDPERRVSKEDRQRIVNLMFDGPEWRKQFLEVGLKKFADKISGAGDITSYGDQVSDDTAADLR